MDADQTIRALREALQASPDNIPLRLHLARTLLGTGRFADAEKEFRQGLALSPAHLGLKVGLAQAYFQQGRRSHALVIAEDVVKDPSAPAHAFILYARVLAANGEMAQAASYYRRGVEMDPNAADPELAERLGVANTDSFQGYRDASSDDYDDTEDGDDDALDERQRATWDQPGEANLPALEKPKITFADVGGMEPVKEEIRMKIIYPLQHADMFKAYGKSVGGGILLYGPPGCGKTHLARATAGEIHARFVIVGINDVLDMWIGNSEKNLHELFAQARRHRPCVMFFDEVDALGASRADVRQSGARHLVNQFLAELDGVKDSNEGLLILAATNAPWHLDSAFRRPGRFDRILFVPPPDGPARAAILRLLCQGKPTDNIDFDALAKKTEEFSGADLKAVVDIAIEAKLRDALKAGVPKPLNTKDLLTAAKSAQPSTREWFASARNYALYANQGGHYDAILKYLKM